MTQTTGLKQIRYREFMYLVLTAKGPFTYCVGGAPAVCDPLVYMGRAWGGRENLARTYMRTMRRVFGGVR